MYPIYLTESAKKRVARKGFNGFRKNELFTKKVLGERNTS